MESYYTENCVEKEDFLKIGHFKMSNFHFPKIVLEKTFS
jgi:hypothetical protein